MPDFIFLDINMPGLDGFEVLKRIKENNRTNNIPVYMYSTSSLLISRNTALNLGARNYFSKPVNQEEMFLIFDRGFQKTN